MEDMKESGQE